MLDLLDHKVQTLPTSNMSQEGDTAATVDNEFAVAILSYRELLYGTALRRFTHNPQDAEDLVQDVMLQAMRFAHTYQRGTNLKAWLFRILTNTAINHYRKNTRMPIA